MTEKFQPWQEVSSRFYDSLRKAFGDREVNVVMKDETVVGFIAFVWGRNGGCRAWVHEWGDPIVYGRASGGGYDLRGGALADLFKKNSRHPSPLVQALATVTYDGQWSTILKEQGFHTHTLV